MISRPLLASGKRLRVSIPNHAQADSEDRAAVDEAAEQCLDDPQLRGYFKGGYLNPADVMRLLSREDVYAQATATDSYARYASFRDGQNRNRGWIDQVNLDLEPGQLAAGVSTIGVTVLVVIDGILVSPAEFGLTAASALLAAICGGFLGLVPRPYGRALKLAVAIGAALGATALLLSFPHILGRPASLVYQYLIAGLSLLAAFTFIAGEQGLWDSPRRRWSLFPLWRTSPDVYELRWHWLNDIRQKVLMPNAVEAVNTLLGHEQDKLLRVLQDSEGLRRLQDPAFRVSTRSVQRTAAIMSRLEGGSIALSGPRGAGKSTVLKLFCEPEGERMLTTRGIAIYVSAPARYAAQEFIADLFQRLCEAYLQYSQSTSERRPPAIASARFRARLFPAARAGTRAAASLLILAGAATLAVRTRLVPWPRASDVGSLLGQLRSAVAGWWRRDPRYFEVALLLAAALCWPRRYLRRRPIRRRADLELTARARDYLARLQVDKTVTKSAGFTGPGLHGATAGWSRGVSTKYIPWTFPELVGQARQFMADVAGQLRALNRDLVIGIDEVDRIETADQAERFIAEVKSIFGVPGCYFLVAVAENVGSLYGQRTTAGRSVLDNAFDEIVNVRPLDLAEAKDLLVRRVPGFTDTFVYLAHALSGGLPRELIRISRRLEEIGLERVASDGYARLDYLAHQLVAEAIAEAIDAARNELSRRVLPARWAPVFDELRVAAGTLRRPGISQAELRRTLKVLAHAVTATEPAEFPADEHAAISTVERLSAFAFFGLTVLEAFGDDIFDLDEVRRRSAHLTPGSYEQLAAALVELNFSAASSRMTLCQFRESLRSSDRPYG
jgi:hypothetical protein